MLTAPVDPTADYVIQHLSTAGVPVARVDSADFPVQLTASATIKPGSPWAVTLNDIDLDDVTAIYYRRPGRFMFSPEIPDPYLSWCEGQARYGFWGVLESLPARWVNHPRAVASTEYKPRQISWAHTCGLTIPRPWSATTQRGDRLRRVSRRRHRDQPLYARTPSATYAPVPSPTTSAVESPHSYGTPALRALDFIVTPCGEWIFLEPQPQRTVGLDQTHPPPHHHRDRRPTHPRTQPMSVSSPGTDTERTRALRERMVTELVDSGALTDDAWRQAFTAVPRHALVPRFYRTNDRAVIDNANPDDQKAWLEAVYSNKTLVTQITPTDVTSSGTMPGLLAKMLTTIRINTGDNALHVGTGTGYTALLCKRLGSNKVTTIDIDPALSNHARTRLDHIGYTPTVVTGNGAQGYPPNAPYDAILATCALRRIPADWLAQTAPGARILAPWPPASSHWRHRPRSSRRPIPHARRVLHAPPRHQPAGQAHHTVTRHPTRPPPHRTRTTPDLLRRSPAVPADRRPTRCLHRPTQTVVGGPHHLRQRQVYRPPGPHRQQRLPRHRDRPPHPLERSRTPSPTNGKPGADPTANATDSPPTEKTRQSG
ncbi:MAG: MvdC/MvdD family ATP grasp protein [Pseudonocardiaceae bacterium]